MGLLREVGKSPASRPNNMRKNILIASLALARRPRRLRHEVQEQARLAAPLAGTKAFWFTTARAPEKFFIALIDFCASLSIVRS